LSLEIESQLQGDNKAKRRAVNMINHRLQKFAGESNSSDEFLIWLNTTMLKLADVLIAPTTTRELRQ
jgi:hypothetical protein